MANDNDINKDGIVDERELMMYERRAKNRRRMAWLSLVAMIVVVFSILFFVPETKVEKLDGLLDLFWIGLASVVGAYVGIESWMSKK